MIEADLSEWFEDVYTSLTGQAFTNSFKSHWKRKVLLSSVCIDRWMRMARLLSLNGLTLNKKKEIKKVLFQFLNKTE